MPARFPASHQRRLVQVSLRAQDRGMGYEVFCWAAGRKWERFPGGRATWFAVCDDGHAYGPVASDTCIQRMGSLGFQVWQTGTPASGYFTTFEAAAEEAVILMAEDTLGQPTHRKAWTRKSLKAAGAWSTSDILWDDD